MHWEVSAATDRGSYRSQNEDMLLLGDALLFGHHAAISFPLECNPTNPPYLLGVADGLGGHKAGEVASRAVLEAIRSYVWSLPPGLPGDKLRLLLDRYAKTIHDDLLKRGERQPALQGMGTTLAGILFYEGRTYRLGAGDSRVYRYRKGKLQQLSRDHTLSHQMNDPRIDPSIIVNSFGGGDGVSLDVDAILGSMQNPDVLLLCSDGLSDAVDDAQLADLLEGEAEAAELAEVAKQQGSTDNISVIVARRV